MCLIHCRVVWQLKDGTSIVKATPTKAVINPHEKLTMMFRFIPKEVKHYSFSGVLVSVLEGSNIDGASGRKIKTTMRIEGEGTEGEIVVCSPSLC